MSNVKEAFILLVREGIFKKETGINIFYDKMNHIHRRFVFKYEKLQSKNATQFLTHIARSRKALKNKYS